MHIAPSALFSPWLGVAGQDAGRALQLAGAGRAALSTHCILTYMGYKALIYLMWLLLFFPKL